MNLDALVAPLRADVVSGAAVLARAGSDVMRRGAIHLPADSSEALAGELAALAVRVLDAQPVMAPMVHLLTQVLESVKAGKPLEESRRAAAAAAERFRDHLERSNREAADSLAEALPENATVFTLSSSSSVRSGLLMARKGLKAICLESRPMNEGQALARTLAQAGIPVTLAVDAAVDALMDRADVVLLGADSVGDAGVVNKIGSVAAARSAKARGIPVWVAADQWKWLPEGFPQPLEDDRPADEVWRGSRGVRVWNRYFECLTFDMVDGFVCEDGVLEPPELNERRADIRAAAVLRDWAARYREEPKTQG